MESLEHLTAEQISFQLILHSGSARSKIIEAIRKYRQGSSEEAERLLNDAEKDLGQAHHIHFQMIQSEASGQQTEFSLLMIHAEDHLMSTLTMKELVKEILDLFKARNI
ncbi:Oligo-beta-mannoside-specific phosphotransferase enzyme IIA component [Anoxybacillus ayderensis]|jgi:PTS system cellobiose-specific IIA component|uniref:Oligo-beta-mannoside-specific phosphotransferase enzyme IIA component n=1 Tax=Anoxybacillus ayderensis TaxID=265546 RepID=A0A0D0HT13_9BACL|nr:PTS lactose/cellobiose transporter subunit IIA [Anoxybacillus ayderensis]KIP21023.1 Oligo-beta-mannoside-specific phosphotransferase enzyme IIA component [Anoxybacillus ayderensis]